MNATVRTEDLDVNNRLNELGLTQEALHEAARRGQLAYISCTSNHPPMVPGIWAWGETVCGLRESLLPLGWESSDENNYSIVIGPSKKIAIAVCTGDEGTGRADATPSNKAPKGPSTMDAVETNQVQLNLFIEPIPQPIAVMPSADSSNRVTWILLVYRGTKEVRCELSLPSSIGIGGRIDDWQERILLAPISLDTSSIEIEPPALADINVEVKRKA